MTIYVHERDLNGTLLSDVEVAGQDATGKSFESITDSNGLVTISGQPGTWQFTFTKEGYDTLNLYYNVTETDEATAYIQKSTQPDELL
ncbi:MAG: carboxypeptidase-like regulatory domain-containing protein [Methanotrichaceae archaeon]|nr:carboxypeptidase-like regulatory domain-containing protein [Methanotrichaceae archaeon]